MCDGTFLEEGERDLGVDSPLTVFNPSNLCCHFSFSQKFADSSKWVEGPSKRSMGCNASSPRKRLMLSASEKEKLLNWDTVVSSEESANSHRKSKEQVDFKIAAFWAVLEKTELSQDVAVLFISVFLPCVASFPGPKIVAKIRTSNSTLDWPAFFLFSDVLSGTRRDQSR